MSATLVRSGSAARAGESVRSMPSVRAMGGKVIMVGSSLIAQRADKVMQPFPGQGKHTAAFGGEGIALGVAVAFQATVASQAAKDSIQGGAIDGAAAMAHVSKSQGLWMGFARA